MEDRVKPPNYELHQIDPWKKPFYLQQKVNVLRDKGITV